MIIARDHSAWVRLFLIFLIFSIVNLIDGLTPVFETWNSRFFDVLFIGRSSIAMLAPAYDDTVVHIDLDDTSIQQLQNYYLNRTHHAKLINNLSDMGVSAQLHDVIFAAPANHEDDATLIEAVQNSNNVYLGLAFRLSLSKAGRGDKSPNPDVDAYLTENSWNIETRGNPAGFYHGHTPLMTFPELAKVSRGLGYLNLTADPDGVFRRIPLLVRFNDSYYPSAPFRLICDYLGIRQSDIVIEPGEFITLLNPKKPRGQASDSIKIPIDNQGNMVINFIGPWARMKHYHFSDVLRASEDQSLWDRWGNELSQKIVVVSDVTTGSTDVGTVPTDIAYPLSGVGASVIHTILSGSFIRETPAFVALIVETIVLGAVFFLSLLPSTLVFTLSVLGIAFMLLISSATLFFKLGIITQVITSIIMVLVAYLTIQVVRALEHARRLKQSELKRSVFEREMEIGRQIQSGFFPETLPDIAGWEISAFFRPTRQVSGDFYDAFPIDDGRLYGLVMADVCDKGVGAALFMALTRSLLRAFTVQNLNHNDLKTYSVGHELKQAIRSTNDYIAETHGRANMFATLFIGILDPRSGTLTYINCGHEPPIVRSNSSKPLFLRPTGPALGMFPAVEFQTEEMLLHKDDLLLAFTDGVTDAQNDADDLFSNQKVLDCLTEGPRSSEDLVEFIVQKVDEHVAAANQFDDITLMAVRRIT